MAPVGKTASDGRPGYSALRNRLEEFSTLTPKEGEFVAALERAEWTYPAGANVVEEGRAPRGLYVLKNGWAIRYKSLQNGTRLILDFVLPGEFVSLGPTLFGLADETVATITDASLTLIALEQVPELFRRFPKLAISMVCVGARQEACLTQRLVSIARRPALQRIAHLLTELRYRQLNLAGTDGDRLLIPITQTHLADCLGLSSVHVNRMLRQLREQGLVTVRRREIIVTDTPGLKAIAEFDDRYLNPADLLKSWKFRV